MTAPAAPDPSPAPTPAFTPKPAAAGPVTRPNGQVYQPRALAGMPDVEVLRRLRADSVPALLESRLTDLGVTPSAQTRQAAAALLTAAGPAPGQQSGGGQHERRTG